MPEKARRVLFAVALVVFCVSAFNFVSHHWQEFVSSRGMDNIRHEVIIPVVVVPETGLAAAGVSAEDDDDPPFATLSVDFDRLLGINPDIVGWIYIPGGFVSYPLLQCGDNHRYLTTTFDNRQNVLGGIFLDFRNNRDFEDFNTIIYGHDTRNDMMFGSLKRFEEQSYVDEHRYIHIIREHEVRVYEIFSVYETLVTRDMYTISTISFASEEGFAAYLHEIAGRSRVEAAPLNMGRIITLSTCTPTHRDKRLLVHAQLVAVHDAPSIESVERPYD